MQLVIRESSTAVGLWAARYVQQRIQRFAPTRDRPFVLGLPTGGTPVEMYRHLVEFHQQGELSFAHVVTFNLDEYVGLSATHPQSYHAYMNRHLFDHVDIPRDRTHLLNGNAANIEEECAQYEAAIQSYGGIELLIGGVGIDGHIAFNEPGSSLRSRTRIKALTQSTKQANARFFGDDVEQVPHHALTMGVGTIMDANEVMIMAQGSKKSLAVHHAIEGAVNHLWTISALQLHPHSTIICDEEATLELKVKTVRYFKTLMQT
ncbi:glucosamine-6-phosphate deaminase [Leptolyngbya sp. AN02str]|uniref:glucosamine-6-phosphate deaminase n=1 Tax=Leptolyngbya sp. AN02str TaxID=3423363 RepID=UPI003D31A9CE